MERLAEEYRQHAEVSCPYGTSLPSWSIYLIYLLVCGYPHYTAYVHLEVKHSLFLSLSKEQFKLLYVYYTGKFMCTVNSNLSVVLMGLVSRYPLCQYVRGRAKYKYSGSHTHTHWMIP